MTDAEYLADSYFATVPKSAAVFHDYTEKIKVSAWPDETAATPTPTPAPTSTPAPGNNGNGNGNGRGNVAGKSGKA